jgi:hypothetical protein
MGRKQDQNRDVVASVLETVTILREVPNLSPVAVQESQ